MASFAGASLSSGGVSSPPGHRNGAWGASCGVRPGCGVRLPVADKRHLATRSDAAGPGSTAAGWAREAIGKARAGDPRALARLISLVENSSPELRAVARALAPLGGQARVIGLTGAPGVGK